MNRIFKVALVSLLCNVAFSAYHLTLGIVTYSWWLLTLGIYYLILSLMRFFVLKSKTSSKAIARLAGAMLVALSVSLIGTVVLSVIRDRGHKFNMIPMLAIAVYAFAKITVATVNFIKSRKSTSVKIKTLRSISLATAFVSIFALQRSMLVSFDGMNESEIVMMNAITGFFVCAVVLVLGLNLLTHKKIFFKFFN